MVGVDDLTLVFRLPFVELFSCAPVSTSNTPFWVSEIWTTAGAAMATSTEVELFAELSFSPKVAVEGAPNDAISDMAGREEETSTTADNLSLGWVTMPSNL